VLTVLPKEGSLISVVDDDRSVVEAMVSLIQSVGYKAKGFRSAEDFLKSRQLLNIACLILDVRMPSMEGLRTTAPAGFWELPNSDHFPSLHMIVTMFISKRFKLVLRTSVQTVQPGISVPSSAWPFSGGHDDDCGIITSG